MTRLRLWWRVGGRNLRGVLAWLLPGVWAVCGLLASPESVLAQSDAATCVSAHADAQVFRNRGAFVSAHERLLLCARSSCPKPIADDCATWLGALEDSLASIVLAVSDEQGRDLIDVRVTANGVKLTDQADGRAISMDPGLYTLRFSAEWHAPAELSIAIRQSEKNRIVRVQLRTRSELPAVTVTEHDEPAATSPAPTPTTPHTASTIPIATYVLGATTLIGAGMYAYFGLTGLEKEHKVRDLPADAPCGSLCGEGKRAYVLADIGLGIAVASAAGAIATFVLLRETDPSSARVGILPLTTQRGVLLHWSGSF
ncbi:MAG: hypothetical protein RL701_4427 [Pseudomonadota bacterium]